MPDIFSPMPDFSRHNQAADEIFNPKDIKSVRRSNAETSLPALQTYYLDKQTGKNTQLDNGGLNSAKINYNSNSINQDQLPRYSIDQSNQTPFDIHNSKGSGGNVTPRIPTSAIKVINKQYEDHFFKTNPRKNAVLGYRTRRILNINENDDDLASSIHGRVSSQFKDSEQGINR